ISLSTSRLHQLGELNLLKPFRETAHALSNELGFTVLEYDSSPGFIRHRTKLVRLRSGITVAATGPLAFLCFDAQGDQ
ncbi:hypothetical protein CG708_25675, partial [Salmonella enterica subsp. enterica serovar Typhimurium]